MYELILERDFYKDMYRKLCEGIGIEPKNYKDHKDSWEPRVDRHYVPPYGSPRGQPWPGERSATQPFGLSGERLISRKPKTWG